MDEVWRDIPGFEGYYQASSEGSIRSVDRIINKSNGVQNKKTGKVLKQDLHKSNRFTVVLSKQSNTKTYFVHRLVYLAFYGDIPCGKVVNHKDENPQNNKLENLNLLSQKENLNWGTRNQKLSENRKKTVYQYTLDGELVNCYESTISVSDKTGYSQGNISNCCNGKAKTAYGYVWKFV